MLLGGRRRCLLCLPHRSLSERIKRSDEWLSPDVGTDVHKLYSILPLLTRPYH
jgi:hypothetical protein